MLAFNTLVGLTIHIKFLGLSLCCDCKEKLHMFAIVLWFLVERIASVNQLIYSIHSTNVINQNNFLNREDAFLAVLKNQFSLFFERD